MRILLIMPVFLFIFGCSHYIKNPLQDVPQSGIDKISSLDLCENASNRKYIYDEKVLIALKKRGYTDCSQSELYCNDKLGLKYGTNEYINCMIQMEGIFAEKQYYDNQQAWATLSYLQQNQPKRAHSITCFTNRTGNSSYTNCN